MRDLANLPKAELHLHLEGAMRPSTLRELCIKYSIPIPSIPCYDSNNNPKPHSSTLRFSDFSSFADVYFAACACLQTDEDVHRLVLEIAQDLKKYHVMYAEIAPYMYCHKFSQNFNSAGDVLSVLVDAASIAEKETGVVISYIVGVERHLGVYEAMELARLARKGADMKINGRPAVVGFGLHGPEKSHPPEPFEEAFHIACEDGKLASVPHAGEVAPTLGTGAKSVLDAVQLLNAKRIAHGVLAKDDAEIMQVLKERDVVLDMAVTSNYLMNVVKTRESHPIRYFLKEGIQCTINSDDPLLFGCNILSEYQLCREVLGMDDFSIAQCAKASFRYSCAPEQVKREGIMGIDKWLSA